MSRWLTATTIVALLAVVATGWMSCRAAADMLIPIEEENKLGDEFAEELEEELEFYPEDTEVVDYVRDRGDEIVRAASGDIPDGIEVEFHVVDDDDTVNAFAIPGGGVYVYTGLMKAMENEAEFMGVLGHEVAHVSQRHIAQRLVTIYGMETVSAMALGDEPGLVAELVTAVAVQGYMLSYSRDNEREADEYGVEYQIRAGTDPEGFISFFEMLAEQPTPPTFLSSHPPPDERADNIREQIEAYEGPIPDERNQERFQQIRDQI